MFLIDISVPRNIDPSVRRVDNAFLFDIDDLQLRVEQNRTERMQEAAKAERMVAEEVASIREWMKSLEVTPTIVALRSRVDEIRRAEVDKVLGRLPHLSPQDRELVEGMASSIVNKLIHRTMVTLKTEVNSSSGPAFVEAARRFFHLDKISSPDRQVEGDTEQSRCLMHDSDEPEREERAEETSIHKRVR
jgi:glutamyl-tRNA reductase